MWDFANKIFVQQSETRRNTHKSSWKKQETGRGKLEKEETLGSQTRHRANTCAALFCRLAARRVLLRARGRW